MLLTTDRLMKNQTPISTMKFSFFHEAPAMYMDPAAIIVAVEYVLMRETTSDGQTIVTETVKVTHRPIRRTGKPTITLRRMRSQNSKRCSMSCVKTCLSLSNAEAREDRRYRCQTCKQPNNQTTALPINCKLPF